MQPERIDAVRGDALVRRVVYLDEAGEPFDLTGFTARSQIRHSTSDTSPLVTLTVEITDEEAGEIEIRATDTQMAAVAVGRHVWDLEIDRAGDDAYPETIVGGELRLTGDATR